jgi:hypothetical protein
MKVLIGALSKSQRRSFLQCCGSRTFWYGSGSGYPCLWLIDPDPDPAICVTDLQIAKKESKFSYYFCLMIEETGSGPLINGFGSGSRRAKNMRILRIRITNTDFLYKNKFNSVLSYWKRTNSKSVWILINRMWSCINELFSRWYTTKHLPCSSVTYCMK